MSSGPQWTGRHALLWLVPLAIDIKALFAFTLADVFQYGEELEKGTAAKAMLDGLDVPHHQLAYHYYEGGGFVASHLKALAFTLIGENVFAHKLVALYFVALVLCAGWALTRQLFGDRAALWFGLLYIFGPASFQKLSVLSLGIHFEACLFLLLALCLTARIAFREDARWHHYALLGLVTGFGLYFSYQMVLVAGYAALWLLVARPRQVLGPGGFWGLAGFAMGALPLWIMHSLVGDQIFDIHGTSLAGGAGAVATEERLRTFFHSLYDGREGSELAGLAVWPVASALAVFAGLVAFLARGAGAFRKAFIFVLGYALLFLAVYLESNFVVGKVPHYFYLLRFAPLWIACTVLIAAAIGRLTRSQHATARAVGFALASGPLAFGLASTVSIVRAGRPGILGAPGALGENVQLLARTKGYLYAPYFAKLVPHLDGDDETKLEKLLGFDEPERDWLRADIASELFLDPSPDWQTALGRARETIARVEPEHVDAYDLGLGPLLLRASDWKLVTALERAALAPPDLRARLIEALGRTGSGDHPVPENFARDLALGAASADPAAFARGTGWRVYEGFQFRPDRAEAFLSSLPADRAPDLRAGYEAAVSAHRLH